MINNFISKIFLISFWFKKYKKKRIRSQLRGYNYLKSKGKLDYLNKLKLEIVSQKIFTNKNTFPFFSYFFNTSLQTFEISLKQYLYIRLLNLDFNKEILISIGKNKSKIYYPLPKKWRLVLEKNGFKADFLINKIYWNLYVFTIFSYGLLNSLLFFLKSITNFFSLNFKNKLINSIYFHDLSFLNLPFNNNSDNIISWYNTINSDQNISYTHSVNCENIYLQNKKYVQRVNSPIPLITNLLILIKYSFHLLLFLLFATYNFLRGKFYFILFYNEIYQYFIIKFSKKNDLANKYLFHLSNIVYRKFWSYEAEKKGTDIIFYFYATNTETFKFKNKYNPNIYLWNLTSWTKYLVWNSFQKEFVKRSTVNKPEIEIVGPINFSSSSLKPLIKFKYIAVFDVQPFRDSVYTTFGQPYEYYKFKTNKLFFEEIIKIVDEFNLVMVYKRKRNIKAKSHTGYSNFLINLNSKKNVMEIAPDVSPYHIIKNSILTISMPFTSTSLIAENLKIPNCYFDPIKFVDKTDRASHNIEIINNSKDLRSKISELL